MALAKAPGIGSRIAEIVMMAGACCEGGNITPAAEFNVFADPDAADVVLRSGIAITMAPLDVTHQVLVTPERLERLRSIGNRAAQAVVGMLRFSEKFDREKYRWAGAPLHDPNVIAYLLEPALYEGRTINVTVETASELTLGMTVADWWRVTDRPGNVRFLRGVDATGFFELLTERLRTLP
jgi:purine nucleosidase